MTIRASVLADLVAHAREEAPKECCGLLLGRDGVITASARARNARASPTAYLVDPGDHFAAIRRARREAVHVTGAYHSHPRSRAMPSATDIAEAHDPELLYVIVSLPGVRYDWRVPDVRAWRIVEGTAHAVPLDVMP